MSVGTCRNTRWRPWGATAVNVRSRIPKIRERGVYAPYVVNSRIQAFSRLRKNSRTGVRIFSAWVAFFMSAGPFLSRPTDGWRGCCAAAGCWCCRWSGVVGTVYCPATLTHRGWSQGRWRSRSASVRVRVSVRVRGDQVSVRVSVRVRVRVSVRVRVRVVRVRHSPQMHRRRSRRRRRPPSDCRPATLGMTATEATTRPRIVLSKLSAVNTRAGASSLSS